MTTPQQPPAGWYPDPQDATQQRYWDGSAWTGNTSAPSAAGAAPEGAAATGAPIPTEGAPAWAMQPGAGVPVTTKKSWYKRPLIMIPLIIVIVLVVVGAIIGTNSNRSNGLEKAILHDGQQKLQASISALSPGATAKIDDAHCVETGSSQEYNCLVHYTVIDTSGTSHRFVLNVAGSCDSKGNCLYHATGPGTPVP